VSAAILERPAPSVTVAPPGLDHVLQRCVANDPDKRWQSARDLHIALEWATAAPPEAVAPKLRSHRFLVLIAAAFAPAVAGGVLINRCSAVPRMDKESDPFEIEEFWAMTGRTRTGLDARTYYDVTLPGNRVLTWGLKAALRSRNTLMFSVRSDI
jgi:hypothetical protein